MNTKVDNVLLHGCYDNRNFGDVLMADMLSRYLAEKFDVTVRCPGMLEDIAAMMPCSATTTMQGVSASQVALFGGGGYLHGSSLRNAKRMLRYTSVAALLRAKGIPYSMVGVGAGPLINGLSKPLLQHLCGGAKTIAVREEQSGELLKSIGVPAEKIEVTADLVMGLQERDIPEAAWDKALEVLGEDDGRRKIGVHLSVPVTETEMLRTVIENVREGLDGNQDISVYWIQDHGNRTEDFRKISAQIFPQCQVLAPLHHWELLAVLSQMDMVLTTELHVAIASWALGKPVCGFSNHQKATRFFSQICRKGYQVMGHEDPTVVSHWVNEFACEEPAFFNESQDLRNSLVAKSQRNFEIIDDLFDKL